MILNGFSIVINICFVCSPAGPPLEVLSPKRLYIAHHSFCTGQFAALFDLEITAY